jgi:hypothetical protein
LNFKCSFEDFVAVGGNCCDLMSIEDHCNESLEMEDTSEVIEESVPLPSTDDCGLIFRWSIMTCVFLIFLEHDGNFKSKLP